MLLPLDEFDAQPYDVAPLFEKPVDPYHVTTRGALFSGDCMAILPSIRTGTVDTVFADPPFNLGKTYGKSTKDDLLETDYLMWCGTWLSECMRILKPGRKSLSI